MENAIRKKHWTYRELTAGRRYRLLVAPVEIGGRWDELTVKFLVGLAKAKARSAPAVLRTSLTNSWFRRWTGMLAFAVHDAFAASLVEDTMGPTIATDGELPAVGEVLAS